MRSVTVTINGEEKQLRFDINSTSDLEEYFGKGIAGILQTEQMGFRLVRAFYWAGLKWKDRGLTLERTGKMLNNKVVEDGESLESLMKPVLKALEVSGLMGKDFKVPDEEEEEEVKN